MLCFSVSVYVRFVVLIALTAQVPQVLTLGIIPNKVFIIGNEWTKWRRVLKMFASAKLPPFP